MLLMKKISFYLPQFHQEPLNNKFWDENFTDWETSQHARPIYNGHIQPVRPLSGQYNLDDPDCRTLRKQVQYALSLGVDGFSFYFYLFDESLSALRKPVNHFISSDIEYPFCLTWANHSWSKAWVGEDKVIIAEQRKDSKTILSFSKQIIDYISDSRYIKVSGKPVIVILDPSEIDIDLLRCSVSNEYKSRHNVDINIYIISPLISGFKNGIDQYIGWPPGDLGLSKAQRYPYFKKLLRYAFLGKVYGLLYRFIATGSECKLMSSQIERVNKLKVDDVCLFSETLLCGWDNTPRYKNRGYIINHDGHDCFISHAKDIVSLNRSNNVPVMFVKAFNEWAEGNLIEKTLNGVDYGSLLSEVFKCD